VSRGRFATLLFAAVVALAAALWLATQRNATRETQGAALLPTLAGELNSITAVDIRKGSTTPAATLQKSGDTWTVAERGGYPADVAKLRKLLTALSDAKIVEEKTSDPARYAAIGVEDMSAPGATGAEVTIIAGSGQQAVIVGKSVGEGSFVRRAGEKTSYSVEPAITVETDPHFWIDARLIDVPASKIQSIAFKPPSGSGYAVRRPKPDAPFSLEGAPAGRKPLDAEALAPAATTFTGLSAEDVAPLDGIDFSQPFVTELTLTDGDVITLTGAVSGTHHWVQIRSSKEPALSAKTQGRAFEVASYRYDEIFKPLESFLTPKPAPVGKSAQTGESVPASRPVATGKAPAPQHP